MKRPPETLAGGGDREMQANHSASLALAEPTPGPTLPDPASRRAAVLEALHRGERLTQADALRRGWGWRLAADVFALKDEHGWPIAARLIPSPGGNDVAEYWLPADSRQMRGMPHE